jgi:hypothetical protein
MIDTDATTRQFLQPTHRLQDAFIGLGQFPNKNLHISRLFAEKNIAIKVGNSSKVLWKRFLRVAIADKGHTGILLVYVACIHSRLSESTHWRGAY